MSRATVQHVEQIVLSPTTTNNMPYPNDCFCYFLTLKGSFNDNITYSSEKLLYIADGTNYSPFIPALPRPRRHNPFFRTPLNKTRAICILDCNMF